MNLNNEVLDLEGKSLGKTFKQVLSEGLLAGAVEDRPENKYRYFALSLKLRSEDAIKFDQEERAFILEKIRRVYYPLYVGRIEELFNNNKE